MLPYLTAENAFVRTLGNRCLLLLFLCALTRTGSAAGTGSFQGISVQVSQGLLIVAGPVLALFLLLASKLESDNLEVARREVAAACGAGARRAGGILPHALFTIPTLAAAFLVVQFWTDLVPASVPCPGFDHMRFAYDASLQGGFASKLCIGDVTADMPWIYPPSQLYAYGAVLLGCAWLSVRLSHQWLRSR